MFDDKVVLITGGTGSFGQRFTGYLFEHHRPKKVIIFSRDEFGNMKWQRTSQNWTMPYVSFGDIRDKERLYRSFEGVDYVIHAAFLAGSRSRIQSI